jgi:hypothetical protein
MDLKEGLKIYVLGCVAWDRGQLTFVNTIINRQKSREFGSVVTCIVLATVVSLSSVDLTMSRGRKYFYLFLGIFWRFRKCFSYWACSLWLSRIQGKSCLITEYQQQIVNNFSGCSVHSTS